VQHVVVVQVVVRLFLVQSSRAPRGGRLLKKKNDSSRSL